MPDPATTLIQVNGGGLSQMTLAQLLDQSFGATPGRAVIRLATGWTAGHCARFHFQSITGVTATTGGAIASWVPQEGAPAIVTRAVIYTTVKSTGAANVSIGVGTNTTTSSANLIDTLDVGTAVVCADNYTDKGTNGKSRQLLTGAMAVTVTGSADTSGLVGNIYIEYIVPSA